MHGRRKTLKMGDIKPYDALFLDRDGVINVQRRGDYVKSVDEFVFIEGSFEALAILRGLFRHIFVVTNQRGVGKGLMAEEQLENIHAYMLREISSHNGKIDKIYYCTDTNEDSPNRKPNIGMALQARHDFPNVDFSKSKMAGDSRSDMLFANRADIPAILIGNKYPPEEIRQFTIEGHYSDLLTFARQLMRLEI